LGNSWHTCQRRQAKCFSLPIAYELRSKDFNLKLQKFHLKSRRDDIFVALTIAYVLIFKNNKNNKK